MSAERRREKRWKQKGRNERKRAIQVQREIVGRTMTQKMRENGPLVVMSQRCRKREEVRARVFISFRRWPKEEEGDVC